MRRLADTVWVRRWKGYDVTVRAWCDPTDIPWADAVDTSVCGDKPPSGSEGWDLGVEVELVLGEQRFTGDIALGSCWGDDKYISQCIEELIVEAYGDLELTLRTTANGREVANAKARQKVAKGILVDAAITKKEARS